MNSSPFILSMLRPRGMIRRLIAIAPLSGLLAASSLWLVTANSAHASVGDQLAKLLASDGAAGDGFGFSVAISGNTAIVSAAYDNNDDARYAGSAYLFDVTTGTQLAKLLANDGSDLDGFGVSVAICSNTAIVGAYLDDTDRGNGFVGEAGSAYLFDVTTGTQLAKLVADDRATADYFGISVSISGNSAIVGVPGDDDRGTNSGSAYLFDVTTGTQLAKIFPTDGAAGDSFGGSVAVSGNLAIVGAGGDDELESNAGAAYLFDVTTGTQIAKLLASDGTAGDVFGVSVAIDGNTAIVGATGKDDHGELSGAAYLFDVATGAQLAKLVANDGTADDSFGHSVSISGNTAIVGASGTFKYGYTSGSAYLFDVTTGTQIAKLLVSDGTAKDEFGFSVSLSGNTAIVGAYHDDDIGDGSGLVYLFSTVPEPCTAGLFVAAAAALLTWRRRR